MQVYLCDRCNNVIFSVPNKIKLYSHDGDAYLHDALLSLDLCDECLKISENILKQFTDISNDMIVLDKS